jgi:hypothetical protein
VRQVRSAALVQVGELVELGGREVPDPARLARQLLQARPGAWCVATNASMSTVEGTDLAQSAMLCTWSCDG